MSTVLIIRLARLPNAALSMNISVYGTPFLDGSVQTDIYIYIYKYIYVCGGTYIYVYVSNIG